MKDILSRQQCEGYLITSYCEGYFCEEILGKAWMKQVYFFMIWLWQV